MKKLVVMTSFMGVLFLLGALLGVQHMNEELGISQPEPLPIEQKQEEPVQQNQTENQNQGAVKKDELVEKKQRVEDVGRFNFFSEMGSSLAEGANRASRAFLSQVMSFVHNVLNG
ncbi:hypothetical protein [Halalkalibacter nanhaiisediminis]|uniref:DUF3679 domain-containing protein n=1 Tax=Halalkalibacter nanhaiisediminis TaxID=688079 RepID=A0A562QI07_9BACI|nr:hypothetical protein [Halalkalibacter nanhaiisediminis]TWI56387.1 hypothetical protein IQ10_02282 [Halalkalibacter nanhaiisediminis]